MEKAITIWVDESTEIGINDRNHTLVGYLITDSDKGEFEFLNALKQARKVAPECWVTLHGSEISETDSRQLALMDRWLAAFHSTEKVYFHSFLYRRNDSFIPTSETYEHYFAKQSVFALANKMKGSGYTLNTMFKDVSTLTVMFEGRRAHTVRSGRIGMRTTLDRLNNLEAVYKDQITRQIARIAEKKPGTNQLTVRFSFLSAECFDAMQFADCVTYLIRKKLEQEQTGVDNAFTKLFDKHFLNHLDQHTKDTGFRSIYSYSKKFNVFESSA
ncbi:MAG: hypothetical protein WD771_07590 [Gemmatimonadaceae bacterium]